MNFILKLGMLLQNKVADPEPHLEMDKILDLRERLFKREKLDKHEHIQLLLDNNEECLRVAESKMKEILFSIQTTQNEKKLFDSYRSE